MNQTWKLDDILESLGLSVIKSDDALVEAIKRVVQNHPQHVKKYHTSPNNEKSGLLFLHSPSDKDCYCQP